MALFKVAAGSIVLSDENQLVVIRLASDSADPLDAPVVNRLDADSDWTLLIPGSAIADMTRGGFRNAINDVVEGDSGLEMGKRPAPITSHLLW